MRIGRRPFALALTIGLHTALLLLLTLTTRRHSIAERSTTKVVVFTTRALKASLVGTDTAALPTAAALVQDEPPDPVATGHWAVDSIVATNPQPEDRIRNAGPSADPFSNAGLPSAALIATLPNPESVAAAQTLIDAVFASIVREPPSIACSTFTASFVTTVEGDGSVSDVHFIGGSLGAPLGDRLAHALETKIMFAPSADGSTRRMIIGPVRLSLPEQSGRGSKTSENEPCRG